METTAEQTPAWAGVDWGTSNLRVWVMSADDTPLHSLGSSAGMGTLQPDEFEPTLVALLEPWLDAGRTLPVICCGMVGARQGWSDAGYLSTPVSRDSRSPAHGVATHDDRISVAILPGVKQASPADVMRGEETQIAGLLHQTPAFDGTVCLPGTHTKWARVESGCISSFQTCMSGEMFALLSTQSVLRHSMQDSQWSDDSFTRGVSDILANPASLSSQLFALRAENLINDVPGHELKSRLSGLLLGAELAATRTYWQDKHVTIVGDDRLAGLYSQALSQVETQVAVADGASLTLAGLIAAHHSQQES
ncbi:2-dehydro-3-deoxygalactonokinase [Granulosicoccus sp. 3-233]|uniref:2-dehydro-3-deoxygalactonokinase n=1 Tax=Granulosicoccus sp. 3-233 TaxID=3417969 RepID=UPI003D32DAAE